MPKQDDSDIAVIGIGCRFPGANSPASLWENVLARKRQFRKFRTGRLPVEDYCDDTDVDGVYASRAAYIDGFRFDWAAHRIPKQVFESTDVAHWLALDVALQTLSDAGVDLNDETRHRTGVFVGNTLTGEQSRSMVLRGRWPYVRRALRASMAALEASPAQIAAVEAAMEPTFKSAFPAPNEDTLQGGLANTIAGRICNYLDLHGGGYVVDGACASSLLATITAANHLVAGDVDLALAGGVDVSLDPMELVGFSRAGALTRGQMRVYDRRGDGFIPGEGAGFVALKRLADARRDGDRVYAVLRGWGVSSDGKGGITAPSAIGQARAIIRAHERAGLRPQDLDFVEGHGTGTRVGDEVELRGLERAFAHFGGHARRCGVTSLKSLLGHMKAAAGAGGLIKAILAVNQRVVPPTAGVERPHAVFEGAPLYPIVQGEARDPQQTLRAGVSAMGFGGINTHVVLESGDAPAAHLTPRADIETLLATEQSTELFCFSADDVAGLEAQLSAFGELAAPLADAELASLAKAQKVGLRSACAVRLALVADDIPTLLSVVETVLGRLGEPLETGTEVVADDRSYCLGNGLPSPTVAFVFPGQGSQVPGTAHSLVRRFGWAKAHHAQFVSAMRDAGHLDIAQAIHPPAGVRIGPAGRERTDAAVRDTQIAQPLICWSSMLYVELFRRLGIEPACVVGHSLGELTAAYAAGCIGPRTLLDVSIARGRVMGECPVAGTMASVAGDEAATRELIEAHAVSREQVEIANLNSARQTVVSGTEEGVARVLETAKARGVAARLLNVSHAFHSRLMEGAVEALDATTISTVRVESPRCALLSSVDGEPFDPSQGLLAHMKRQLRAPVNFVAVAATLREECDLAIELGPRRVLSTLLNDETGSKEFCVSVEPRDDNWSGVNDAVARLFVWGREIQWEALYAERFIADLTPDEDRVFIDNPCERPLAVPPQDPVFAASELSSARGSSAGASGGLSADSLLGYLSKRGKFILNVIEADLEANAAPGVPEQEIASAGGSQGVSEPASTVTPTVLPAPREAAPVGVYDHFVGLVAGKTGFAPESITGELRLLDELNLDSIKAGEVLLDLVRFAGLEGQLAYESFTNASITEIVEHVEAAIRGASEGAAQPSADDARAQRWVRAFELGLEDLELQGVGSPRTPVRLGIVGSGRFEGLVESLRRASSHFGDVAYVDGNDDKADWGRPDVVAVFVPNLGERSWPQRVSWIAHNVQAALATGAGTVGFISDTGVYGMASEGAGEPGPGLAAMICSLREEHPQTRFRLIDVHDAPGAHAAATVADLLCAAQPLLLATVAPGGSRVRVPTLRTVGAPHERAPLVSSRSDVWLVTGGAKGITLECALAAAEQFGGRFALVGSSAGEGSGEVASGVRRFEELGLQAEYFRCDVRRATEVDALLERVTRRFGPVAHVIHGAGRNHARRMDQTTETQAWEEIAPKISGIEHLLAALAPGELRSVVGISSIIGVAGMPGNAWYALSNEALDAAIRAYGRANPHVHARTVAYSVWGQTGMGSDDRTLARLRGMGVTPIETAVGRRYFVGSYGRLGGGNQLVVTGSMSSLAGWDALRPTLTAALGTTKVGHPGIEAVVSVSLDASRDAYLPEHDFQGTLLLPTVFGLEQMASVALAVVGGEEGITEILDVRLDKPVTVRRDEPREIEIHAVAAELGADGRRVVEVAIYTAAHAEPHFSATMVVGSPPSGQCSETVRHVLTQTDRLDVSPATDLYGDLLFQGKSFQRMGPLLELSEDRVVFEVAPAVRRDNRRAEAPLLGDPFVRDVLLQAAQLPLAPDLYLPIRIGRIERFASSKDRPPHLVVAEITERDGDEVEADVTLYSRDAVALERLHGYRARLVKRRPDRPRVADYLDSEAFNQRSFQEAVQAAFARLPFVAPRLQLHVDREMSALERPARHARQREQVAQMLGIPGDALTWSDNGAPQLSLPGPTQCLSLSHDEGFVLYASGAVPLGCDVEVITPRRFSQWQFLLGRRHSVLFNRAFSIGGTIDESGYRVWSALEVAEKLGGVRDALDLDLYGHDGESMTFHARKLDAMIVTFPFRPLGTAPRMVAIGVTGVAEMFSEASPQRAHEVVQ